MVGEWSNDFDTSFKYLNPFQASIIAGKELADIIVNFPGPYSARAVLYKVISVCKNAKVSKQVEFYSVIESLDKEWIQKVIDVYNPNDTDDITPVITALSKSIEVSETKEWIPSYKKATGIDPEKIRISPEELAYQVYLECLTIKYYYDIED
jgi:hypothetical protein